MSRWSKLTSGILEGNGGIDIFFQGLTLLLSCAIFCGQGAPSSFTDRFRLAPFPEVLCILGSPAAHCSTSASTDTGWNLQVIFFPDFFVLFQFLPFAFSKLRKEVEDDKKKILLWKFKLFFKFPFIIGGFTVRIERRKQDDAFSLKNHCEEKHPKGRNPESCIPVFWETNCQVKKLNHNWQKKTTQRISLWELKKKANRDPVHSYWKATYYSRVLKSWVSVYSAELYENHEGHYF